MSCASGPNIIKSNQLFNFDAAHQNSYSGTGYTWYDLKNNRPLSISLGEYSSNNFGALNFPIGNEYFSLPLIGNEDLSILGTTDFTIETVVRSDDVAYPRSRHPLKLFHTVTGASTPGWSCGHSSTSTSMEIMCADGTNHSRIIIDTDDILESTYYHRVLTVSRSSGLLTKLFINGKYIGQANATNVTGSIYNPTPENGSILGFGNVWGWRYIGEIFIIKIYDKVLTDNEIIQNHNALRSRFNI